MDKLHMITANGTVQWPRCNGKFYDKEIVDWANRLKLELLCGKARILSDKLFVTYSYTDCNDSLVYRPLGHIVDYHPFGYSQGFSEIHGVEFKFKFTTKDNTMMLNHIYAGGKKRYGITDIFYQPKKQPTTIVKFTDGSVEVVKLKKGDKNDIRVAIMYAIMKHDNAKFNHDMQDLEDMVVVQDVSRK